MLESKSFARHAPTAQRGLNLVPSSNPDGFERLFSLLSHTMPHLGALGVNPQSLIDTLLLQDGDDVYEFMAKVLQVEETITVSKLVPSPNALIL